jgi:hypothetical protein
LIDAANYPLDCGLATTEFSRTFIKRPVAERSFDVSAFAVNRITAPGSISQVTVEDKVLERLTSAGYVTDYLALPQLRQADYDKEIALSSSSPAVLAIGENGQFTYQADGSCTLFATAEDGEVAAVAVTTTSADPATVDSFTGWADGSLAAHCEAQVASRLSGSLEVFTQQDGTTFIRNPACWASGIDLTCASPWNSTGGLQRAGTLISPRHVLFCEHADFHPAVNASIKFVSQDGAVVTRTITALETHPQYISLYPDITIGVLDSDVPASISFAKVLPDDWAEYLPNLAVRQTVPILRLNQQERATTAGLWRLSVGRFSCVAPAPAGDYYEPIVVGDSGNPVFLIVNAQPILVGTFTFGGAGSGTFVSAHIAAINTMMDDLGGGYTLTEADLSAFSNFS